MRTIAKEVLLLFLFATPIGYLLSLFKLINTQSGDAVIIQMDGRKPLNVNINYGSLLSDRIRWSAHGLLLLIQSLILLGSKGHIENPNLLKLVSMYIWFASLLGITTFISGLFPNFPWNKRPFGISIFEIIFFISLFAVIGILTTK